MKMRFSIGARLISIITIIVLISLCSVTALVSWLVRRDLQATAEDYNAEINRRTAMETEAVLANIRSHSRLLIRTITAEGTESAVTRNTAGFFFEDNPRIAAIFFTSGSQTDGMVVNSRFFRSREIDEALVNSYRNDCVMPMRRAEGGETVLLNAAPHFFAPVLALFFPCPGGGAGVLFSQAQLDDAFCFGAHQSYLVNGSGDILIHADFDLVRDGVNVADNDFIRYAWNNQERDSHVLYTDEDGTRYFRAFTKLNTGGCTVITGIEYDEVFEGIAVALRCNVYLTVAFLLMAIMFIWFIAKNVRKAEEQK
jgi:adenylate cyclase